MHKSHQASLTRASRESAAHVQAADLSIALSAEQIRQSRAAIERSLRLLNRTGAHFR